MKFSIVIPTYNRCAFLIEAIESVLAQTYQDFEIVVIDDGSTDNTESEIKKQYSSNPKVIYIKQKNAERGAARNNGIQIATGDYIVFLDSDDLFYKNHLSTLHKAIIENPSINFLATKNDFNDGVRIFKTDIKSIPPGIYGINVILKGNPIAANICIKKNNPNLILFQEQFFTMEDWIFLLQNLRTDKILLIDKYTVSMREHANRSMRSSSNIAKRRLDAMHFIIENVSLEAAEKNQLESYSYYFCAIHSYIDCHRIQGLKYIGKAIKIAGLRIEFATLIIKIIIGQKLIGRLRYLKHAF